MFVWRNRALAQEVAEECMYQTYWSNTFSRFSRTALLTAGLLMAGQPRLCANEAGDDAGCAD